MEPHAGSARLDVLEQRFAPGPLIDATDRPAHLRAPVGGFARQHCGLPASVSGVGLHKIPFVRGSSSEEDRAYTYAAKYILTQR